MLSYHPKIEDQGKFLSCRAENPLIPDSGVEKGFKLNLHRKFSPIIFRFEAPLSSSSYSWRRTNCFPLRLIRKLSLSLLFSNLQNSHINLRVQTDPPLITLEFGTNPVVEGNIVSEGADVYFECNIKANPWVYRVAWKQNVRKFASRFITSCTKV